MSEAPDGRTTTSSPEADQSNNMPPANGATVQLWLMWQAGADFDTDINPVLEKTAKMGMGGFDATDMMECPRWSHIVFRSIAMASIGSVLNERAWEDPRARDLDVALCPAVLPHATHWWERLGNDAKADPRVQALYEEAENFILWWIEEVKKAEMAADVPRTEERGE